jgi:hypothetical protein
MVVYFVVSHNFGGKLGCKKRQTPWLILLKAA